jgi:phytoene dehydrogenase-like protein
LAAEVNWDAIVVGGGHNGLVCAAYLARAGQRVLVLERREVVGGMADTSELLPGVRVPTLAHTVGRLRPSVVRELGLTDHGLALVQPEVRLFAPHPDGHGLTLWGDVERTAKDLAAGGLVGRADADAYATADAEFRALAAALSVLMSRTPPDLASPTLADAVAGVKLGLLARSRADSGAGGLLRVLPMAVADLVGEWFENDRLRATIAARGVLYTGLGPLMPGTAQVLLADSAGNDGGLAGQAVFARGGPRAVGDALDAATRSVGVDIRTGAEVAAIRHRDDIVTGVTLASGEEIDAAVVVSGTDPKTLLLDLVAPETLGPRLSWRATNIRAIGATAKVNLALGDLPKFAALAGDSDGGRARLRGRIVIAPSMSVLHAATAAIKYGRLPEEPLLEATIPSLVDRELVDAYRPKTSRKARHVMSVIVQSIPYDADGTAVGDLAVKTLEIYAPGIGGLVVERQVITPRDIERDYGATGGHPMHAEIALDQWFAWRPLHGYGRYRMPLRGLYLCGSGAHPGGGVTGGPGQLAAHEVLADVRRP